MKLQVSFKHLDASEALTEYTRARLEDISHFLLKEGQGQAFIGKIKNMFHVEITVNSKEKYFKAIAECEDPYVAVDMVVDKLEKQFLKSRKFNTNHKKWELSKSGKLNQLNSRFESRGRYKKAA